jgi:hypothetical protein
MLADPEPELETEPDRVKAFPVIEYPPSKVKAVIVRLAMLSLVVKVVPLAGKSMVRLLSADVGTPPEDQLPAFDQFPLTAPLQT